jgi:hypothetical protein
MRFPTFGVHKISYEGLKKFNHGWAYLGRGWIVALLRSAIGDAHQLSERDDAVPRDLKPRRDNENPSSDLNVGLEVAQRNLCNPLGRLPRRKVSDIL